MEARYETIVDFLKEVNSDWETASPNATRQLVGPCPFCDRAKKFYVNVDTNSEKLGLFKCQVCGEGGSFADLKKRFSPPTEEQSVYRTAASYFIRALLKNPRALEHLIKEREFSEEEIARFGFGYAGRNYIADLKKEGLTHEQLSEYGFLSQNDTPIFFNHIIIPYISGGEYKTFKGRSLEAEPKLKFVGLSGRPTFIYNADNLYRSGRVFLTEGEIKTCQLVAAGYNAVGLSGAGNFGKFIPNLNAVSDLWIILDSDSNQVGQKAATKLAALLDQCHVVHLTLPDGEDKIGVDDYLKSHTPEEFESLLNLADHYIKGEKQKPQSLAVIVSEWRQKAKSLDRPVGLDLGFPRLNDWLGGGQPGSLGYILAAPHIGKSALLRSLGWNLYKCNPDLLIDYHSLDDSNAETIPHFVAMIGELNADDCKQPEVSFANNKSMYRTWEAAVADFIGMSGRFTMLDRSYRKSLEDIREELMIWRDKHPQGKRALLIDGFDKIYCREAANLGDTRVAAIIKSDQLKLIAQEADVFVLATDQPPKLYGQRPKTYNVGSSASLEFDASIIISLFQEAHYRGLPGTNLKQIIEYADGQTAEVPCLEAHLQKNKQRGVSDIDIFLMHRNTSTLEEIEDADHRRFRNLVYASEQRSREKKFGD